MHLQRSLSAERIAAALSLLGIPITVALRDPVHAMRLAACADADAVEAFARVVCIGGGGASVLVEGAEDDEGYLAVCAVLARLLLRLRRPGNLWAPSLLSAGHQTGPAAMRTALPL